MFGRVLGTLCSTLALTCLCLMWVVALSGGPLAELLGWLAASVMAAGSAVYALR